MVATKGHRQSEICTPQFAKLRFVTKSVISSLLPLCLAWSFVACVSICGMHCEGLCAEQLVRMTNFPVEIDKSSNCDDCPVNAHPAVKTQKQVIPKLQSQTFEMHFDSIAATQSLSNTSSTCSSWRRQMDSDPPYRLLPTLRI